MTDETNIAPTCSTCRYWQPPSGSPEGDDGSYCRRHAPVVFFCRGRARTTLPMAAPDFWCGAHEEHSSDTPVEEE